MISFIELGISELNRCQTHSILDGLDLSLHLARTPITEGPSSQNEFINHINRILHRLDPNIYSKIVSIGVHLTGSRFLGAGIYGAADEYCPIAENRHKATRFILEMRKKLHFPLWIENANIYSGNARQTLQVWHQIGQICEDTGCLAIVDLAHLAAEAHNNSVPAVSLLGCLPWRHLAEFHLSGIVTGSDGCMHDGHGSPVHREVWALLEEAFCYLTDSGQDRPVFTIEHTMPAWTGKQDEFQADFQALGRKLKDQVVPPRLPRSSKVTYMKGYLRYYLGGQIRNLEQLCSQRNISINLLLDDWTSAVMRSGKRIVFDLQELPPGEREGAVGLVPGFLEYVRTRNSQGF